MSSPDFLLVAVLIPCYNEAATVEAVVRNFQAALPGASIYVFDNNSSDATAELARGVGAVVVQVADRGKGNVVRRMFADVDADVYVLVDGDDTYDASAAPILVSKLLANGLDMVVATRRSEEQEAYRLGHRLGNVALTQCVGSIFGRTFTDMLSGYRVFSRRYVKSFPAHSKSFEIETELTVHALELSMPVAELATEYKSRPEGSVSKLNTYRDGFRILMMIVKLFRAERPLAFYSTGFLACALSAIALAIPLFTTYMETGLVPRLPTAILCTSLMLFATILLVCGIILDAVTHARAEIRRLAYLSYPAPSSRSSAGGE
ncbi:glycosyltransferase family 2 protein [Burkholderia sp. S171]|uniref:glycosyltransferase family 2 protein n=1 Tax=Burkholderia sp. S171 TaxID=1641860 RepID=UPI00131A9054|nr:glycosyltransferase family 2 protein [Burkholderia sp. S171]